MQKIGTFLAVLVLIGVFFKPGKYGFVALIILLMYGLISFPYKHLTVHSKIPGKWSVNWSEFRQQIFLNSLFVFLLFLLLFADQVFSIKEILITGAVLLITIIYSLLMGMYKENSSSSKQHKHNSA